MPVIGIGMNRKRNVLVHAGIAPPDSLGIRIGGRVGLHSRKLAHLPLSFADFFQIDPRTRHAFELILFIQAPTSHMVRAGDDARRQPLGDPGVQHEESDFGVNFEQVAGANIAEFLRIRLDSPTADSYAQSRKEISSSPTACGSDAASGKSAAACTRRHSHLSAIPPAACIADRSLRLAFPPRPPAPSDECDCDSIPEARIPATSSPPWSSKTTQVFATACCSQRPLLHRPLLQPVCRLS